ncbi:MAG: aminodeoxychorismate synthase component I [Phycisphaerae bacterium]|nr:aminodeoxychorismate synthase component I [Phycisphaerae bacterium]
MSQPTARLLIEPIASPPALNDALAAILAAPQPAILDSSALDVRYGRYCILACEPAEIRTWTCGIDADGLEVLRQVIRATPPVSPPDNEPGRIPFSGGWIGFLSYEAGRWIERLPAATGNHRFLPTIWLGLYDTAVVIDRIEQRWWLVGVDWPAGCRLGSRLPASDRMYSLGKRLRSQRPGMPSLDAPTPATVRSDFRRDAYEQTVQRVIDYIGAGDVFQVNVAQRLVVPTSEAPADVFLRLRRNNPSCFGAYLQPGDAAVVSASPELFFTLRDRDVVTRPIKGTRRRSPDPVVDASLRRELCESPKDAAELAMIIDLERNDLGRVCEFGSVRVTEARTLEPHPTVHHLVGTVVGRLREGLDVIDLLRAAFPGGSITGAPKIRAMEIIDELERAPRGVYCGSIGWIGLDGSAAFNIAIRTITMADGEAEVYAGGGIVTDSLPPAEYEETLDKAAALLRALGATPEAARDTIGTRRA